MFDIILMSNDNIILMSHGETPKNLKTVSEKVYDVILTQFFVQNFWKSAHEVFSQGSVFAKFGSVCIKENEVVGGESPWSAQVFWNPRTYRVKAGYHHIPLCRCFILPVFYSQFLIQLIHNSIEKLGSTKKSQSTEKLQSAQKLQFTMKFPFTVKLSSTEKSPHTE